MSWLAAPTLFALCVIALNKVASPEASVDHITTSDPRDGTTNFDAAPESGDGHISILSTHVIDMFMYGYTIVGCLSVCGNTLNIIIMRRQKNLSPFTYLTSLAACDLLTGVAILWNSIFGNSQRHREHHYFALIFTETYVLVFFLRNSFASAASYLTTALSVDRLIAVKFPLQRSIWCSVKRARIISLLSVILGFAVNVLDVPRLAVVWDSEDTLPRLTYTKFGVDQTVSTSILYVTMIFKISLPLALMAVSNAVTWREVAQSLKFREEKSSQSAKSQSKELIVLTVGVIATFVITNIPQVVYKFRYAIYGYPQNLGGIMLFLSLSSELMMWTNSCSNFFIYLILNANFRQDASDLFKCQKKVPSSSGLPSQNSQTTE